VRHVDDLIEACPEQIARSTRLVLFLPHAATELRLAIRGNPKKKLQDSSASCGPKPCNLKSIVDCRPSALVGQNELIRKRGLLAHRSPAEEQR